MDTYIAPLLLQKQPENAAQAMQLLETHIKGNRFAKSAVETALLDGEAKRLGVPLSALLGGALHQALPVAWTLASGNTERDIAEAVHMIEAGRHRIFKLKIGLCGVEEDVRHVLAIKKALGSSISVRVDVNQAWTELEAMRGIALLQEGGIDLIEQPVAAHNRNALKRLSDYFSVALMGEFDDEGRYIEIDLGAFAVISLYVPSGSSSEERLASKFRFMRRFESHVKTLNHRGKPYVIAADWNVAHREIDLKNWRSNQRNPGFLPEERQWIEGLIKEQGLVDVYRQLHPDTTDTCYTWWSNRGQAYANNVGWRLDYHLATPQMAEAAREVSIYKDEKFSDHAPITIQYAGLL